MFLRICITLGILFSSISSFTGCGVAVGTIVDTAVDVATYPIKEYIFMGSYKYDNTWPEAYQEQPINRDHGEMLLGIAVSGGGSRSAYFMACVMQELNKIPIKPGSSRTFADEVDYISSVSGGSLSSAYFCFNYKKFQDSQRASCSKDFFEKYKADMRINFQNCALVEYTLGGAGFLDFFSYYDRGDLIANIWDQIFFDDATFQDLHKLEQQGAPILLINGTILNDGLKFVFSNSADTKFNESQYFTEIRKAGFIKNSATQKYQPFYTVGFQSLNSDIRPYRLSKAIVASAAVPNLLGPVSLKDYTVKDSLRIVHIVDGGVYDNYGLETLMQIFTAYLDKHPETPSKILVIDGSGYFQEDNRRTDEFTVADFSMRPLEIAWLRSRCYMEYVFKQAISWKNAQGIQPYKNLSFDLISLYGCWSSSQEDGKLPSQEDITEKSLERQMIETILRPDLATQEFFNKIVHIPTSFKVSSQDAEYIEEVAQEVVKQLQGQLNACGF